jgi:hypothetical protein
MYVVIENCMSGLWTGYMFPAAYSSLRLATTWDRPFRCLFSNECEDLFIEKQPKYLYHMILIDKTIS